MEDTYKYEAVILGDDLPALFAGYLLKKNRIRFVMAELDESLDGSFWSQEDRLFEVSEENKKLVEEMYRKLAAQVGIAGDVQLDTEDGKKRFATLLRWDLQDELENKQLVTDIVLKDGWVLLKCNEQIVETEAVILQEDIFHAGIWAQAVVEEKQRRMEEDMRRLRIKEGKRKCRKMVYVTHSRSWFYAKEAVVQFAVKQGVAAVNPFMNYGFYLNGAVEKDEIMECCHQLIRTAEELWVFGPVSEAILTDIAVAVMEGKEVRFFSISERASEIRELQMDDVVFEREVHAGQIRKSDLLNFVGNTAPKVPDYVQMSLFD